MERSLLKYSVSDRRGIAYHHQRRSLIVEMVIATNARIGDGLIKYI